MREASCLTHHVSANLGSYELSGRVRSGIDELSFHIQPGEEVQHDNAS